MLLVPAVVEELGEGPAFPLEDQIDAELYSLAAPPCPASNGPALDLAIRMTNLTGRSFTDVWYVADSETQITNADGTVLGSSLLTFKIDAAGANVSLIFEDGVTNGIWEPGETWRFVLQDFSGVVAPYLFGSVGLENSVDTISSGSIIAIAEVPLELPLPELLVERLENPTNDVQISFQVESGFDYELQTGTSLNGWSPLASVTGDDTLFQFIHMSGGGDPHRFYRAVVTVTSP